VLTIDNRNEIVDGLFEAYRTHTPIKPLKPRFPLITLQDAYAVQQEFVRRKLSDGRKLRGYKIGLTSKAMQEMAGSTEPDYSALTDDLVLDSGADIQHENLFSPLVEIEIAFVMKERLKGPGVTEGDVICATDFIAPAIELVDLRVERGPGLSLVDNIADLAYCGAAILGSRRKKLDEIDVSEVKGTLWRNGVLEQEGMGSAVMGNPITVVAWLANKLSEFDVTFEPGHVILTGSFVRAIPVKKGDRIEGAFDHDLGRVLVQFL
jgi:2-oxo-hept-3-ene-1,7-dioate hydratase/2-keto-4-pentenoate hydratase